MSLFDLTGKVALVTGATKGIGLGVSRQLAAHGARLILSSRNQSECDARADEFNAARPGRAPIAAGLACDIEDLDAVERLGKRAIEVFGGVDILVCNAAVLPHIGPSAGTSADLFNRILIANIHHNFRLCQAVRASMANRGGGSIVLIGSMNGHRAAPETMAYSIAKAGVAHMARCLADEFAVHGIRVNCVAPGLTRSDASRPLWENSQTLASIANAIPLRRIGEPDDIAGAVVFLSSRAGSYVSGSSLIVDGGQTSLSVQSGATSGVVDVMHGTSFN